MSQLTQALSEVAYQHDGTAATRCVCASRCPVPKPSQLVLNYVYSLAPPSCGVKVHKMRKRKGAQPANQSSPGHSHLKSWATGTPACRGCSCGTGHSYSHPAVVFDTGPMGSCSKRAKTSALTTMIALFSWWALLRKPCVPLIAHPSSKYLSWEGQKLCLICGVLMHVKIFRTAWDTFPLHEPTKMSHLEKMKLNLMCHLSCWAGK